MKNQRLEDLKLCEYLAGQEVSRLRLDRHRGKPVEDELLKAQHQYHRVARALANYQSFLKIFSADVPE